MPIALLTQHCLDAVTARLCIADFPKMSDLKVKDIGDKCLVLSESTLGNCNCTFIRRERNDYSNGVALCE
jgi:hypothetical protein